MLIGGSEPEIAVSKSANNGQNGPIDFINCTAQPNLTISYDEFCVKPVDCSMKTEMCMNIAEYDCEWNETNSEANQETCQQYLDGITLPINCTDNPSNCKFYEIDIEEHHSNVSDQCKDWFTSQVNNVF